MDAKELARLRTFRLMETMTDNIKQDGTVNITAAAEAVGISAPTFYRWLAKKPQKVDMVQIAALADYLHETYGHEDFAALWRRVKIEIPG